MSHRLIHERRNRDPRPIRVYDNDVDDSDDDYYSDEDTPPSPCILDSRQRNVLTENQPRATRHNMPLTLGMAMSGPGESRSQSHRERVEPRQSSQWSSVESNSIQQWREMAAASSRASLQGLRRHRENRTTRSHESLCSDASSDDSTNKKPREIGSYIKYLVRGFLRDTRPRRSAKDDGRKRLPEQETFVPSPKIMFLIDRPDNLVCQVCQVVNLKMAITAEIASPYTPSLFPCGHIFCYACTDQWLSQNDSCPICRMSMTYASCNHQVEPRLIAQDTIHTVPETLPNGGKIGRKCFKCCEREQRHVSLDRWASHAVKFKEARRDAERLGTDEAIEKMKKAQKTFERLPEDDFWILSRRRHHQW